MDYYSLLGVDRNADQNQIKQAYRNLVKQHHPDRGGDADHFKKINRAYETLGDPNKREQYDNPQPQQDFNPNGFDDMFSAFFGQRAKPQMRNRDIKIAFALTLEDVLTGKDAVVTYKLSNGSETSANIKIHAGVEHGEAIRFRGLGDNHLSSISRGDLIIFIRVVEHREYAREGRNLKKTVDVGIFDLILGTKLNVKTLKGNDIVVNIPAGTNPGTILSVSGYGLPDLRIGRTGNLYLTIKSITPKIQDTELLKRIKEINDKISSST